MREGMNRIIAEGGDEGEENEGRQQGTSLRDPAVSNATATRYEKFGSTPPAL
jgi:hypothetical protein